MDFYKTGMQEFQYPIYIDAFKYRIFIRIKWLNSEYYTNFLALTLMKFRNRYSYTHD